MGKRLSGEERAELRRAVDRAVRRRLAGELAGERSVGLRCSGCDGALLSLTLGCRSCQARWQNYRHGRTATIAAGEARRLTAAAGWGSPPPLLGGLWAPAVRPPLAPPALDREAIEFEGWAPARQGSWASGRHA